MDIGRHHMKAGIIFTLAVWSALSSPVCAVNMDLSRLVSQDQGDRHEKPDASVADWKAVSVRDYQRRIEVLRMLKEGSIKEPIDFINAALILQHGRSPEEYRLAHALATIAAAIEPDRGMAKQLKRLSWDRFLLSLGRQQWFGSQSKRDPVSGEWFYPPNDPSVTDEQRNTIDQQPLIATP